MSGLTSPPPLSPGEPRSFGNGRFTVHRRLGAGNFATVYLAHDERLDVPVAVKLLSDRWSWDAEVRGRFVQEARLLRSINDVRVVQIRDIAETDDGRPYLVMDYATGGTLEQRMTELVQRQVAPSATQLQVVARAIADALAVLHDRRIAHRDIKPSNLLITADRPGAVGPGQPGDVLRPGERLMLADLGLAKDLAMNSGVTVGAGTAGYMSPEQMVMGGRIDMRADLYAASALLAQIATGEAPDPARRVSGGTVEHGRDLGPVPPALRPVLLRGLDANPDLRQQTVQQWAADVDAALAPAPALAPPPGVFAATPAAGQMPLTGQVPAVAPGRAGSRRSMSLVVGVLALLVVLVVGVVAFTGGDDDDGGGSSGGGGLTVTLSGPRELAIGERGIWQVDAPGAVAGTWSLTGPVQPEAADLVWAPGNWFEGTWNVPAEVQLTLTVRDAEGNAASGSISFTVD